MFSSCFLLSLFSATTTLALSRNFPRSDSWPSPELCSGNCTGVHDPALIRRESDGKWFRLSTNGNIAIASADNITGPWTYDGPMLANGSIIQLPIDTQELWAPDVSMIGDTYYAYYSVSASGYQGSDIGLATSKSLEVGSWTDLGSIGIPESSEYNRIDPNWFRENDTSPVYFNFGSAWDGIFQTELIDSSLAPASDAGNATNLVFNSTVPAELTIPSIVEGSFLFWWETSGTKSYFMFFSSGACCNSADDLAPAGDEYKIMVCRSDNATGPFVDQDGANCLTENGGSLVLGSHDEVYAPGGQGVYYHSSIGRPVVYYHYVNTTIGYDFDQFQFGFNYLDFSSGWPVVVS